MWKQKRSQIAKSILRRKNRAEGIRVPDLTLYYKTTVNQDTYQVLGKGLIRSRHSVNTGYRY